MQKLIVALTLLAGMAVGTAAWAQESGGDKVVYKKRTIIDLSGAVIEGELTKPEGSSYIVNRKLSRFSTLIQARGDFNFELLGSANEL